MNQKSIIKNRWIIVPILLVVAILTSFIMQFVRAEEEPLQSKDNHPASESTVQRVEAPTISAPQKAAADSANAATAPGATALPVIEVTIAQVQSMQTTTPPPPLTGDDIYDRDRVPGYGADASQGQ